MELNDRDMAAIMNEAKGLLPELPEQERKKLLSFLAGSARSTKSPDEAMEAFLLSLALKQSVSGARPN